MLALSKKIDYALIALAWMAEREGPYVSAREIAGASDLPLPVLMQILKVLHNRGVLESTRGVKGGYRIDADLENLSLFDLSDMLSAVDEDTQAGPEPGAEHNTLKAIREKLSQFLRDVRIAEVVCPGRRIDVPLHRVGIVERLREKVSV